MRNRKRPSHRSFGLVITLGIAVLVGGGLLAVLLTEGDSPGTQFAVDGRVEEPLSAPASQTDQRALEARPIETGGALGSNPALESAAYDPKGDLARAIRHDVAWNVRVVDRAGQPVPGAPVQVAEVYPPVCDSDAHLGELPGLPRQRLVGIRQRLLRDLAHYPARGKLEELLTDAQGLARLAVVPRTPAQLHLSAKHAGHSGFAFVPTATPSGTTIELRLRDAAAPLRVQVLGRQGAPLSGVIITGDSPASAPPRASPFHLWGQTGQDGIAALSRTQLRLAFQGSRNPRLLARDATGGLLATTLISDWSTHNKPLVMRTEAAVGYADLTVENSSSSHPNALPLRLNGWELSAQTRILPVGLDVGKRRVGPMPVGGSVLVKDSGTWTRAVAFNMPRIAEGVQALELALPEGLIRIPRDESGMVIISEQLRSKVRVHVDFYTLTGRVVDARGAPLPAAEVRSYPPVSEHRIPRPNGSSVYATLTDAAGKFRLRIPRKHERGNLRVRWLDRETTMDLGQEASPAGPLRVVMPAR